MEAREVRYFEFEDKHGENGEFVFILRIPLTATWEMTHAAAANIVNGLKEWESVNKQKAAAVEEAPPAESIPESVPVDVVEASPEADIVQDVVTEVTPEVAIS